MARRDIKVEAIKAIGGKVDLSESWLGLVHG